jgi:hypothetical protein
LVVDVYQYTDICHNSGRIYSIKCTTNRSNIWKVKMSLDICIEGVVHSVLHAFLYNGVSNTMTVLSFAFMWKQTWNVPEVYVVCCKWDVSYEGWGHR